MPQAPARPGRATGARIRVALVRQRYNPYGGAERFIEHALPALERAGVEVTVLARRWQQAAETAAPRLRRVDPFYIGSWWRERSFARAVRALWQREGYDLVQSHERIAGCDIYRAGDGVHQRWLALRAQDAGPLERLGIALSPHHRYLCAEERRLFAHPRLRAVVCNSHMVRDEIRRTFAVPEDKLHVIYNGVDLDRFNPRERDAQRAEARARLGAHDGELVLAFVGSGFARKGLDTLLAAAAKAASQPRVIVVGRDRASPRFAALAATLGIAPQVTFSGGVEDVRPWYAAADALVLPTRYDPFPNVVLEALAMGLPALVSERCGAAEIVRDHESGYVTAVNDSAALAARIDLLAASSTREALGIGARRAAEPYSFDAMAAKLVALYETLL